MTQKPNKNLIVVIEKILNMLTLKLILELLKINRKHQSLYSMLQILTSRMKMKKLWQILICKSEYRRELQRDSKVNTIHKLSKKLSSMLSHSWNFRLSRSLFQRRRRRQVGFKMRMKVYSTIVWWETSWIKLRLAISKSIKMKIIKIKLIVCVYRLRRCKITRTQLIHSKINI